MTQPPFALGGVSVPAGSRATVDLPMAMMSDHTPVTLSVQVIHGRRPGPTLFVTAAIHGDEVIGVEILRRLLRAPPLARMRGTLLAVPIVNTFGFLSRSRYLPDRRDLNRSFPGTADGSMAARLAHLLMSEIVARADLGIDLHSAAIHRSNLPQMRVAPGNPRLMALSEVFGTPVILSSALREGSLRKAAQGIGRDVLLYEGGEGLRFDERAAAAGVLGILRVMAELGMIAPRSVSRARVPPMLCPRSQWVRAPAGGLMRTFRTVGDVVEPGSLLAVVSDPFGAVERPVIAPGAGILVGRANLPVVNAGDAIFHLAELPRQLPAETAQERLLAQTEAPTLFDEDEIL